MDMTSYFRNVYSDLAEMHNNMHITAKWSRSKSEVEFRYGGCLFFFQNGSSYISVDNWDMSTKFGLLIAYRSDIIKYEAGSSIERLSGILIK